jgi:N-acetylmuramoyl-L-alanine amidase
MHISHITSGFIASIILASQLQGWSFFSSESEKSPQEHIQVPFSPSYARFTLMLDPAGDVKNTGREIDGATEQALTLQIAQEIKRSVESQVPGVRVIIARSHDETVEPLQHAAFANRLKVNAYIAINCFKQQEATPQFFFYYLSYNPTTDFWQHKEQGLQLTPIDQAYKQSIEQTRAMATSLYETCKAEAPQLAKEKKVTLRCNAPLGLPCKQLLGITSPAIVLEIGLKKQQSWQPLVPVIVKAIEKIVQPAESVVHEAH